jgi:hypothetical protein
MERGCGKLFYLRDDAIKMQFQLRSFLSEFNAFSDAVNRVVFFVAGTAVFTAGLAYSVHVYLEVAMPSKGLSRFPSKTPARRFRAVGINAKVVRRFCEISQRYCQ